MIINEYSNDDQSKITHKTRKENIATTIREKIMNLKEIAMQCSKTPKTVSFKALITNITEKASVNKNIYLNIEVQDQSNTLTLKRFSPTTTEKEHLKPGRVYLFENIESSLYNGYTSLTAGANAKISMDKEANLKDYAFTIMPNPVKLREEFNAIFATIQSDPMKQVIRDAFASIDKELFFEYPAAITFHHNEEHGLLFHTVGMLKSAMAVCNVYQPWYPNINTDLIKTAIILHDFFKLKEYEVDEAWNATPARGLMLSHLLLGASFVESEWRQGVIDEETYFMLAHIIASHHGELEYGAIVKPATAEALIVHMVDNLDAKLYAMEKAQLSLGFGEYQKQKDFAVGTNVYLSPLSSVEAASE